MPNMSYCRFHNTRLDLQDCINAIQERQSISENERKYADSMINNFLDFLLDEGVLDNVPNDIDERIQELLNECNGDEE